MESILRKLDFELTEYRQYTWKWDWIFNLQLWCVWSGFIRLLPHSSNENDQQEEEHSLSPLGLRLFVFEKWHLTTGNMLSISNYHFIFSVAASFAVCFVLFFFVTKIYKTIIEIQKCLIKLEIYHSEIEKNRTRCYNNDIDFRSEGKDVFCV